MGCNYYMKISMRLATGLLATASLLAQSWSITPNPGDPIRTGAASSIVGVAPYTTTTGIGASSTSIAAATHVQGLLPQVGCYSGGPVTYSAADCSWTYTSAAGDVVVSYTTAPTLIKVFGGQANGVSTMTTISLTSMPWLTITNPTTTPAISATGGQTSGRVIGTCGSGTSVSLCALVIGDLPALTSGALPQKADGAGRLTAAAVSDIVALWTTCSGFLKSDGTCSTPATGGSVFTGSTAVTSSFSATPTFSLADISVKSPTRFEPAAMTANVTAVTFGSKTAGAKFSVAWKQDPTGGRTVTYGASASNTCTVAPTASITTTQFFEVMADASTVVGTGCVSDEAGIDRLTTVAAPATPTSGVVCWADSTDNMYECKDTSGNIFKQLKSGGDVNPVTGALTNIPTGTTMAGSVLATAIAAPSTPAAGKVSIYTDSTSKNFAAKNDAGVVNHGVRTKVAVSNSFATAIDDDGTVTVAQPSSSNLSDVAAIATKAGAQASGYKYCADAGSTDTYVCGLTPALTAYTAGMTITFKPNTNNTGAATINIDSLGAKSIFLADGSSNPANNDIVASRLYTLFYDGTAFRMPQDQTTAGGGTIASTANVLKGDGAGNASDAGVTIITVLDGSAAYCADAGASDTYACSLSPAPVAYITGARYRFKANTANTGAATINFNSLGAKTIKKAPGGVTTDLADNDILVGQVVELAYDGTNMQMQSLLGNAAAGGSGYATIKDDAGTSLTQRTTAKTADGLTGVDNSSITEIRLNPFDPRVYWFRDDFDNNAVSTGTVADKGWQTTSVSSGALVRVSGAANHPGIVAMSTSTTSGGSIAMSLGNNSGGADNLRMDNITDWEFRFIVEPQAITSVVMKIGLNAWASQATMVNRSVYMEFDPGTSANWQGVFCTSGGTCTRADTGVAVTAATNWYTIRIRQVSTDAAGKISFSVATDGGAFSSAVTICASGCTATATMATDIMSPGIYVVNSTTVDKRLWVDMIAGIVRGLTR